MTQLQHILDEMNSVHNNCASLLESAKKFVASNNPDLRVLGLEMSIAISTIIHEQQEMLKKIQQIQAECGAMAE